MTLGAAERRKVNADLAVSFMCGEIDWPTMLAVWEPEPHEPPEPLDVEAEFDKLRANIVQADHRIAMLRKSLADSDELRKEIERVWREQPALEKKLRALLVKLCEVRQCAVERLSQWETMKEQCIALGVEIEERKGAQERAGSSEPE